MLCRFEVDVALSRPPRADATVYVLVEEPLDDSLPLGRAMGRAAARAAETAGCMVFCRPQVVMPVAIRLIDVVEV